MFSNSGFVLSSALDWASKYLRLEAGSSRLKSYVQFKADTQDIAVFVGPLLLAAGHDCGS